MKRRGFIPQYILSVLLMLAVAGAVYFIGVMDIYSRGLDLGILRLNNEKQAYDYDALRSKALALNSAAAALNITPLDKNAAMVAILKRADFLNEKFGAVMADNPRDQNGVLSVPMLLSFTPASTDDFLKTLSTLVNMGKPSLFISELLMETLDTTSGAYAVRIKLELSNPYTAR